MRARLVAAVMVGLTVTAACTSSGGDALSTGTGSDGTGDGAASTAVSAATTAGTTPMSSSTAMANEAETTPSSASSSSAAETSTTEAEQSAEQAGDAVSVPPTTDNPATSTESSLARRPVDQVEVPIRFESQVADVTDDFLRTTALTILNDERGWVRAGFVFVAAPDAPYRVVLAEGPAVDELCLPLDTGNYASCQNGPVVALNADRWRGAVEHWDGDLDGYRTYLINHEVGHLIGMRHPIPRCPRPGAPAAVMEQQTGSLRGCVGNGWPREWEIDYAKVRPVVFAPLPEWAPEPVPANREAE